MTQTSSPIEAVFRERRAQGQLAFLPFIAAGDPDLEGTRKLLTCLAAAGADAIEIGFPYSDPIADGPVIQASYTRALTGKVTVDGIFGLVGSMKADGLPPLIAMVSFAIIFRHGPERFLEQAKEAGFSGFIVPDLPSEEAAELSGLIRAAGMDLIQLLAPTTTPARTKEIVANSSGFIYCIAVAGTTGERASVSENLITQLRQLKEQTETPLVVGFGISKPEHLDPLRDVADGAIVGSGIVKSLQKSADGEKSFDEALEEIEALARSMAEAAHQSR
ncbi:tryptophan synthase subunit alpha [Rubinisphaera margarita]|uniref:tryptophan synthase subunit alpha n=1 Tax=Rubinisphaera margarita TaxID=2909586 RepID=UPI001EE83183|nr:tryptophan synthase subunit alpha [Rubinisphaera margarita]MCG6155702.1 tryptophan synthase subunit alpha [Rubinisphaera margarita]